MATLPDQHSAQFNRVKERNMRSICVQELRALGAFKISSAQLRSNEDLKGLYCSNYC